MKSVEIVQSNGPEMVSPDSHDALVIAGRVIFPPGTPRGFSTSVYAKGCKWRDCREHEGGFTVLEDGTFLVKLPRIIASQGLLRVAHGFDKLDLAFVHEVFQPLSVDAEDLQSPVLLEPRLGCMIVVYAEAFDEEMHSMAQYGAIVLEGRESGSSQICFQGDTPGGRSKRFESLRPDLIYTVIADESASGPARARTEVDLRPEPGDVWFIKVRLQVRSDGDCEPIEIDVCCNRVREGSRT